MGGAETPDDGGDRLWVDAVGRAHPRSAAAPRIVSLVPSLTELLFDLDLGASVVGRTRYCTQPAGPVSEVPTLGGTKQPDVERLLSLHPSHVVVNVDENSKTTVEAIASAGVAVIATHPNAPMDNLGLYRLLGGVFGRMAAAERLAEAFLAAHRRLVGASKDWPERRVLYLIWRKPWMTVRADTYVGQMLSLARYDVRGTGDDDRRYPTVTVSNQLLDAIDLVLFPSEPFAFAARHINAFRQEWGRPGLSLAPIDGSMVSWYGSRAIRGLDYLRDFRRTLDRQ